MCSQEGIRSAAAAEAAPTTGTLLVKKINECFGIGFCPVPSAFTITVTGNNPTPSTFQGSTESTLVTLEPGTFSLDESGPISPPGLIAIGSGDCVGAKQPPVPSNITGTISAGQHLTCTITNTELGLG
jgi:hypothetical protein